MPCTRSIRCKRAYERSSPDDGARYLVDRVWPRGASKASLALAGWAREAAPSSALRRWFAHDPARFDAFAARYTRELDGRPEAWRALLEAARRGPVTLVYGARDPDHNQAVVLARYLDALLETRPAASSRRAAASRSRPTARRRRSP
jgi:uncharacterized protein YeaO (DUF488 family)